MVFAVIAFCISALGIVGLFFLKAREQRTNRVFAPAVREKIDTRALQAKDLLNAARADAAKLPPVIVRFTRFLIHEAALGLAALARMSERQLHRLADFVSHKHRFEKKETRSEFLKRVSEHKNGIGTPEA